MRTRTILCPFDFSPGSLQALDEAVSFAGQETGRLLVLHVVRPPGIERHHRSRLFDDAYANEILSCLSEVAAPYHGLKDGALACEYRVDFGDPAGTIVQIAHEENVDLIVLGTHSLPGLSRRSLGTVAEAVVAFAPCPVLIVRETKASPSILEPIRSEVCHATQIT